MSTMDVTAGGRPNRKKTVPSRLGVAATERVNKARKNKKQDTANDSQDEEPKASGSREKPASQKGSTVSHKSHRSGSKSLHSVSSSSAVRKREMDLKTMKEVHDLEEEMDELEKDIDNKDTHLRGLNTLDIAKIEEIRRNHPADDEERKKQEIEIRSMQKVMEDRLSDFEHAKREYNRQRRAIQRQILQIQQQGKVGKSKIDDEVEREQYLGSDEDNIPTDNSDSDNENVDPGIQRVPEVPQVPSTTPVRYVPPPRDRLELLMARQTLKQDLPIFDGKAEEWPIFLSQFKMTSEACGLSNTENLQRLQKSLRGAARETVRAMLVAADNVPRMITVLEKRYGKPSVILDSILQQVRRMPVLKTEDRAALLQFVDSVRNLTVTAEAFNCQPYINNPQLLKELLDKLPYSRQDAWGERLRILRTEFPSMSEFSEWLEEVGDSVSLIYNVPVLTANNPVRNQNQHPNRRPNRPGGERVFVAAVDGAGNGGGRRTERICAVCSTGSHKIAKCQKFIQQNLDDRWSWIRSSRYCFACLNAGHSVQNCRSKRICGKDGCQRDHHPLLHREQRQVPVPEVITHLVEGQEGRVSLMILPVKLRGPEGTLSTFAMLDSGSTVTLLDAATAAQLGVKGPRMPLTYQGLQPASRDSQSESVELEIMESSGVKTFQLRNVRTLGNLPLPYQSLKRSTISKWKHLEGIGLEPYTSGRPTILIGLDNANLIVPSAAVRGPINAPMAVKTELGWVFAGRGSGLLPQPQITMAIHEPEDGIHQMVKFYFSTESFGVQVLKEQPRSKEDKRAIQLMDTTSRRVDDRWEIGLLWNSENKQLPDSKPAAANRLRSIERKMDQNAEFSKWYVSKIEDYLQKGYVRRLTSEEAAVNTPTTWYLPHFVNYNPNKPDKPRLVFDGAAKVRGVSLNDNLMQGPDMVRSLPSVLFKFRQRKYAFTGDIKEMFHQVRIHEEDRSSQRFLWRGTDRTREPDTYQLEVMFFGAASSPSSAQYIKNKNASEFQEEFPEAFDAIVNRHYVDDYLDSTDTVEEANKVIKDVTKVHAAGGFQICNWMGNCREILQQIPEHLRVGEVKELSSCPDLPTGRVLGLLWNAEEDCFVWKLCFHKVNKDVVDGRQVPTKRDVLKLVMSVFDPLGFLANSTIKAKILLEEIWRIGIGWDDEIPSDLNEKWRSWLDELHGITATKIPRCYGPNFSSSANRELHIFCDASEQAFCAIAYWRVESDQGIEVSFVTAKTHVAPLKSMSIPRLELQAAVMATRLSKTIQEEHGVSVSRVIFWSDSTTVLSWLRADGKKYLQFVAHRVGEVQESTDPSQWRWIPTKENVADEGTRNNTASDLSSDSRWFKGPSFLKLSEGNWPKEKMRTLVVDEDVLELKREFVGLFISSGDPIDPTNFSRWTKLVRVTAYVHRFIFNCRERVAKLKLNTQVGELTVAEVNKSERWWWRRCQEESYMSDIVLLSQKKPLSRDSPLLKLSPMLDESGILRVRGRLINAYNIGEDQKMPIILHPKHQFTKLLIDHHHRQAGHHGMERVVNNLLQQFYIPGIRVAVRKAWSDCQHCKNQRVKPVVPEMGDLPECRLNSNVRPFTVTGVDYFGPIEVTVRRSHEKRYGVLFTCMSTRAIHLELAGSLSTDSCIMAIRRFAARRGCPREIHSDNGTNFKGANNELEKALKELNQERIQNELTMKGIQWHFIPPLAPHMGGSWERLVKATKVALKATLKEHYPREETLITFLAEAEHTVNSRPLTHVSVDPADEEALTPNHFLFSSSGANLPPGVFNHDDLCLRRQWRISQRLADNFWQRWIKEYLPTLTRRTKWNQKSEPIKIGDVVIIADDNLRRNQWPKGIITAIFPGKDQQVRVVEVRTASGVYIRPVAKICVLDVLGLGEDAAASAPGGAM